MNSSSNVSSLDSAQQQNPVAKEKKRGLKVLKDLQGREFDTSLDSKEQEIFDSLIQLWKRVTSSSTHRCKVNEVLMNSDRPLHLALKLIANSRDTGLLKPKSMSFTIAEMMCSLKRQSIITDECDDDMRMIIFNLLKFECPQTLCKDIGVTFEIERIRQEILPELRKMILDGYYFVAAHWTNALNAEEEFDFTDILLPLIAQNQIRLATDYLNGSNSDDFPIKALQWLDTLLTKDKSVMDICGENLKKNKNFKVVNDALGHKQLCKLMARWAKLYRIDDSLIPNYKYTKTCSYMHYLYHARRKGQMSDAAYKENIRDAAKTKSLQMNVIVYLSSEKNIEEALEWCKIFKIPQDEYPSSIAQFEPSNGEIRRQNKGQPHSRQKFLELNLPANCVIFVDEIVKFQDMVHYLKKSNSVFFDSEWKMNVCGGKSELCLLQLATNERAFVIDCIAKELTDNEWKSLGNNVFNNENILKVGFAIGEDLVILKEQLPMQMKLHSISHFLDIQILWSHTKTLPMKIKLSHGFAHFSGESLSDLASLCCGKRLNKSEQCSNWSQRPLRAEQISYAALDAYCLSLIYRDMSSAVNASGLDFDTEISKVLSAKSKSIRKRLTKVK